jgi:hypothetical protein
MRVEDFLSAVQLFSQSDIPPTEVVHSLFRKAEELELEGLSTSNNQSQKFEKGTDPTSFFGSLRFSRFEKKEKLNTAILLFLDTVLFNPQTV